NATMPDPRCSLINPRHSVWAPLSGIASRITSKTAIRGGGVIYYNPNQTNSFTLATTNPPFGITTTFNNSAATPISFGSPTPGTGTTPTTFLSVFTENRDLPTPRMYQWHLGVSRALWRNGG